MGSRPRASQWPCTINSDFGMVLWMMKGPVSLGSCAGGKVLPNQTKALTPLATSFHRSSGGGVDQAGPAVGGKRAHPETSESAGLEPQCKGAVKRGGAEPKVTLPNKCIEAMRPHHARLVQH